MSRKDAVGPLVFFVLAAAAIMSVYVWKMNGLTRATTTVQPSSPYTNSYLRLSCVGAQGPDGTAPVEMVDHPAHYGGDTVYETIKVIEAWGLGFHLGNVVKYVSRAGVKTPGAMLEDLEKAKFYLDRQIEMLKR